VTDRPPVGAAVDLGSNSVHLLVAAIQGHQLRPLADESVFLGLGTTVDAQAHLGATARADLTRELQRYVDRARALGTAHVTLLGTEPIRRAADAVRIVAEVEEATGIPLDVLSHEEEAYLTLIGVTGGQQVRAETLVVDIGGGSSEFCAVAPGGIARAAGLQLGSGRLTARFATSDPADAAAVAAMRVAADATVRRSVDVRPADLVAVGGTASNLLKIAVDGAEGPVLTRAGVDRTIATLMSMPSAEVSERYFINPKRGPLLLAGAVIVDALMRRYEVDAVRVSEAGIREGAILVADHAGRAWRDRLPRLAAGWRQ
jgi:exopolyphosphatase / guanosine-5'-triphosphate,3'-diphosphate pyrophosphatase